MQLDVPAGWTADVSREAAFTEDIVRVRLTHRVCGARFIRVFDLDEGVVWIEPRMKAKIVQHELECLTEGWRDA
jgi:hypothetical protein